MKTHNLLEMAHPFKEISNYLTTMYVVMRSESGRDCTRLAVYCASSLESRTPQICDVNIEHF